MRLQIKGLNYYQTLELITKMLLSNTNFLLFTYCVTIIMIMEAYLVFTN